MLRAVIFDLDDTLYDFKSAHTTALQAVKDYAREALSLESEAFSDLHRRAQRQLSARCPEPCAMIHSRLIRYQRMLELIGAPIEHAPVMSNLYWTTLIRVMRPNPGMHECLRTIRSMGLVIGIGTNMTADWQFEKLKALDIMSLVDFMVTSEEACAEKPDRRIFELCAEKAGCAAGECAFVGDNLEGDAQGAVNAGMRAVWLNPGTEDAEAGPGIVRIRSLRELAGVIRTLQREGVGDHETGPRVHQSPTC